MDASQCKNEAVEKNAGWIRECFEEVMAGLEAKEKQLKAAKESVTESSKELDLRRETIKELLMQVNREKRKEWKEMQLAQEKGLRDLELRKEEMGSILEKLEEQEKLIAEEMGKLESIQKSLDAKFEEVSEVERQNAKCKVEIELRKKILTSREEILASKEEELMARESLLDLNTTKDFGLPAKAKSEANATQHAELGSKSEGTDADKLCINRVNDQGSSFPDARCGGSDGDERYAGDLSIMRWLVERKKRRIEEMRKRREK